jgi:Family of unknown function (DUF6526)
MQEQSYKNHVRFHPLYHYVLVPLVLITFVGSIFNLFPKFRGGMELWYAIVLLMASGALLLVVVLAREYTKKVQDRVVRAEENFRHYMLTGKPLDTRLMLSQIIALRFASDEEFVELSATAINENLSADAIKKSIKTWKPDVLRV